MKNKILYVVGILAILFGAIALSSYLISSKPEPRKDGQKHTTMTVKAEKVSYKEIETTMKYRGRVTAFNNIDLTAEVSGRLIKGDIRFKEGERFSKNDIIVNIYKEDVMATHKASMSSFLQTLAQMLPDIKVDFPDEYTKWNDFFIAIDPEKPLPNLPEINSNQEKVFLSANNVLTEYYTLQNQEIELSKYTIYAPFNGILKSVNREIGSAATTGSTLATLIRSDKYEIVVPVFSDDIKWVKTGDIATLTDQYGLQQNIKVTRVAGFVDKETQSVNVYLTYNVENTGNALLEGEYVDVSFQGQNISGFEIPREAIIDKSYVYELKDGKLTKIPAHIVRSLNDTYIINEISDSCTIVTESLASISSNVEYIARN